MMTRAFPLAVVTVAALLSCRPDDQRTDTLDAERAMQARENMPPEVVASLDSGTVAFRRGEHEVALAHYRRATELAPEVAAGWFGVYMAEHALGNVEAAQEALARFRAIEPTQTLVHEEGGWP